MLYFACRHHIFELILQSAINGAKLYMSSGPDIAIFKRFKNTWVGLNKSNISLWSSSNYMQRILCNVHEELLLFCSKAVTEKQSRDDYKEFIELVIILLGGTPPSGINIRRPGAYHQARWMAKGIYCLKIFLLRLEFKLTKIEEHALERICSFIIKVYIKSWVTSTITSEAPMNDINFIQNLYAYTIDDKEIANACLSKFLNHLWYLSDECVAFSIFDNRLSTEIKRDIVAKINDLRLENELEEEDELSLKKLSLKIEKVPEFLATNLPTSLFTKQSLNLFKRYGFNTTFFDIDPAGWEKDSFYILGKKLVDGLKIVNDSAERGVKLMEEYNNKHTKNENQKQFLLQVI